MNTRKILIILCATLSFFSCNKEHSQVRHFLNAKENCKEVPNVLPLIQYDVSDQDEVLCIVDSECSFCIVRFIKLYQTIQSIDKTIPVKVVTNDSVSFGYYLAKTIPDYSNSISISTIKEDMNPIWNGFCYHLRNANVITSITNPY